MSKSFSILAATCAALLTVVPQEARAFDCDTANSPNSVWGPSGTIVDVWVSTNSTGGLPVTVGKTVTETEFAVRRAITILNEQSGSTVQIRYRGTTPTTANPSSGLILRGEPCSNGVKTALGLAAQAVPTVVGGVRTTGYIRYFSASASTMGGTCNPITWSLSEDVAFDLIGVTMHELTHAVYAIGHPDASGASCSYWTAYPTMQSIMRELIQNEGPDRRIMKDFEVELAQARYASRGKSNLFQRADRIADNSWDTPAGIAESSSYPLVRMGSLPEVIVSGGVRALAYIRNNGLAPIVGGGGQPIVGIYTPTSGYLFQAASPVTNTLPRPVATAQKSGSNEVLVAYQKRANGFYFPGSHIGYICYKKSTDGGVNYGTETCASSSQQASRWGLSAAYDPHSNSFLIGYAGDVDVNFNSDNRLKFWRIPASGSSLPADFLYPAYGGVNSLSEFAPAISCKTGTTNCLVAWQDSSNIYGCAMSQTLDIDPTTGATTYGAPSSGSTCVFLQDQPTVAWNVSANRFEILNMLDNSRIDAFTQSPGFTTWASDGTLFNDWLRFISSPALSARPNLELWFLKYH